MRFMSFVRCGSAFLLAAVSVSAAAADAPLADAMEKMDRAAVRALLQRRADVNAPQVDGMTALHWAAHQDDVESVELPILVAGGAAGKVKGGRHIKYAEPTPLANVHLTMLDAVGVRLDSFQDSTGKIDTLYSQSL